MKSAEGIAIGFISIWFLGDVFNLVGALWAGLLREVVFLAVWFCIADALMIFSYIYYTRFYKPETQPLLRRRLLLTDLVVEPSRHLIFSKYVLPIIFVIGCGCLGYLVSDPTPPDDNDRIALGPQIVGYMLAALYLGARIPQIIQNHKRKLVEGLSLLFFLFSTLGNVTYAGQILFYRTDKQYVLLNMSWLLGSLGTIFEDCVIFLQFYMYKDGANEALE